MYDREAFYILDEFPGLILLTIYTLLVLFWSEIYYNAIDNVQVRNFRLVLKLIALDSSCIDFADAEQPSQTVCKAFQSCKYQLSALGVLLVLC